MVNERELLEKAIKKLGKGKAKYEVKIGSKGKRIDLVFEKEDEIWLIEAKRQLNFEALGQILTYKKLYEKEISPLKNIKLGIICEEVDEEIEEVCKREEVIIFHEKIGKISEKALICGVCGDQMVKEEGNFKCKTCEYFFGMSSQLKRCSNCGTIYGSYETVEWTILRIMEKICLTKKQINIIYSYCPECREKNELYRTFAEMLKIHFEKRNLTPYGVVNYLQELTYKDKAEEFVNYCLGRIKPYF